MRVKCLAQEHNTMSPARPRTQTTRSGVEHTNHEATAPSRGEYTPSRFMLQKPEISAGLMGLLGSQQTFPYNGRVKRAKE